MRVLVTGAAGMVGRECVRHLLECGYSVTALVRQPAHIYLDNPNLTWHVGDLRHESVVNKIMPGVDVIVHLAARKRDEGDSYDTNVAALDILLRGAEEYGVKNIVYLSTMSAALDRPGLYGETKRKAEAILEKSAISSVILRASVIYSDAHTGIVGTLVKFARLPLVPVIGSGQVTFRPMFVTDVALAIEKVIAAPMMGHTVYDLGGPDIVNFDQLVALVAEEINHKKVRLVHIPVRVAQVIAKLLALVSKKPAITQSNVLGANQDIAMQPQVFWRKYNFTARTVREGLQLVSENMIREKGEGYALLRYVLGPSGNAHLVDESMSERYKQARKNSQEQDESHNRVKKRNQ